MTTFLLIRHGETDYVHNALAGRIDSSLNADGLAEAERLAKALADLSINVILSSPLQRAQQTAAPLAKHLNLPVKIDENFNQVSFGDWEGIAFTELDQNPDWQLFRTQPDQISPPNGESAPVVRDRVHRALLNLAEIHTNNSLVAIFTHGSIIRHSVSAAIGLPIIHFNQLTIAPASVSTLRFHDGFGKLIHLNLQFPTQII